MILLGETEAIKRSVEAGLGVALIQGIAVEREVEAGNLYVLRLRDGDDICTYASAYHDRHPFPPQSVTLWNCCILCNTTGVRWLD